VKWCATCDCPIPRREARANPTSSSPEDLVTLLRSGLAPGEIRLRAARHELPLDPDDSLRALLAALRSSDPEAVSTARGTLLSIPPDRLVAFVKAGTPAEDDVDVLAREADDPFVLEEIVRSRAASDETLLHLARTASGRPQQALISNQARLLGEPALIRALLENPKLTAEGRRLLTELTEEFFEKKARRLESEARRVREESVTAAEEAARVESGMGGDDLALDDDDLDDVGEEAEAEAAAPADDENSLFIGAIYKRIGTMNVSEKIKLAYTGSKEERRILVGDTNKLVGLAVLKSRALSVNEAEAFAGMRNLDEEIYRRISWNREWMRKPAMVIALVRNPRVPLDIALPLLKRLSIRELRSVVRDRNLAPVIRGAARRFMVLKRR